MADLKSTTDDASDSEARRAFLVRCGRFAAVTPPALATLLAVSSVPQEAHASTIGRGNRPKVQPVTKGNGNHYGWFK
jgi:hypothetical protein